MVPGKRHQMKTSFCDNHCYFYFWLCYLITFHVITFHLTSFYLLVLVQSQKKSDFVAHSICYRECTFHCTWSTALYYRVSVTEMVPLKLLFLKHCQLRLCPYMQVSGYIENGAILSVFKKVRIQTQCIQYSVLAFSGFIFFNSGPFTKTCVFRCQKMLFHCFSVLKQLKGRKKSPFSKTSGQIWTGPKSKSVNTKCGYT